MRQQQAAKGRCVLSTAWAIILLLRALVMLGLLMCWFQAHPEGVVHEVSVTT